MVSDRERAGKAKPAPHIAIQALRRRNSGTPWCQPQFKALQSEATADAVIKKQRRKIGYNRKSLLDAYDQVGNKNAKWDGRSGSNHKKPCGCFRCTTTETKASWTSGHRS